MEVETSSSSTASLVDKAVVPGDIVLDLTSMSDQTIRLGAGLRQYSDVLSVVKAGKLKFKKPNKYWVESSQKRNFLVDIKGPTLAFLPVLAFEGGTRRNIPKFEIGTLLYVRVVKANSCMNPELSCTDASGKAAEFGSLKEGYMFDTSTGLARMLLSSPTCPILEALGRKLSYEIAVGLNGRVWVNASSPSTVILVSNAIMRSEFLSDVQQKILVEKLMQRVQG
ncbi:putative exosome complex component rrp40 isoform X3 [Dendrobium catenatum]|uniref:putative exosome complex component rrp40 isoform X3 n=1 Tax=Dendrobium catenatum TaxID=906689 RepID=UPI00109F9806|nr:putative exosome complex component rrp40 isoform X3 [Dendrobium catenatum]